MSRPELRLAPTPPPNATEAHADVDARQVARLLHVSAVSVFVADRRNSGLRPAAASHPSARELDAVQTDLHGGPAYAALRDGEVHSTAIDGTADARWPAIAQAMGGSPFAGASAVPVMRNGRAVGVMMIYQRRAIGLSATSSHYALARLLASALVAAAVREEAMRHLQDTIAGLGALLERVDRLTQDGAAEAAAVPRD
jgi:GAF domain-containing protein